MFVRRVVLLLVLCFSSSKEVFAEATVSLVAVKKNGVAITPTSSLVVSPGDAITAEVYLSGWSTPPFDGGAGLLGSYRVTLAGYHSAQSSGACPLAVGRMILPSGWNAPLVRDECPCNHPYFPNCDSEYSCVGRNHDPSQMAAGPTVSADGVFGNLPSTCTLDTTSLDIEWACALDGPGGVLSSRCQGGHTNGAVCTSNADCHEGMCNAQTRHLVGTVFLKVGSVACGASTYTFDNSATFVRNPGATFAMTPAMEALTLVIVDPVCPFPGNGACCTDGIACEIVSCVEECMEPNQRYGGSSSTCATMSPNCMNDNIPVFGGYPPNCIIDARQPFPPNQPAARQGFTSQTWVFSNSMGSGEDAPNDFTIHQVPTATPPVPPTIGNVTWGPNNTVTLHFRNAANTADFPIQPNRWTCVKHNASNRESCIGFLPGDVSANRTAMPGDILDLIDHLNGLRNPPLTIYQCDIDRSGVCAPADIITEIDLLNGANGFPVQNGQSLPVCPSAP